MWNKTLALFFTCLVCFAGCQAQTDTANRQAGATAEADSLLVGRLDTVNNNIITNSSVLGLAFEKLLLMQEQNAGHVNIVHIGDSHIQADLMTNCTRKKLQLYFGNGGAGFSFPHQLAKTNGSYITRYKSNTSWESRRNIYPVEEGMPVGLSGIALTTTDNFVAELLVKDTAYNFNIIKIITPGNAPLFDIATSTKEVVMESTEPKKITHKIKSGEVLGSIARKYGTSVVQLRAVNGLKSDNIRAGKTLMIPTKEMEKKQIKRSEFIPLPLLKGDGYHYYHSDAQLSELYFLPTAHQESFSLNGLVLENDSPGIIYHSIGVNGAKASDYNKYPLFFEQLPALKPDVVVVSLGTNESFDKLSTEEYTAQLNLFIENIRISLPDVALLVITPPPSLFKRKYPNTIVASYTKMILNQETEMNYASWDLFTEMGGLYSVQDNAAKGIIGADRVHYTKQGYEIQGTMFAEAFIRAFENFKNTRE